MVEIIWKVRRLLGVAEAASQPPVTILHIPHSHKIFIWIHGCLEFILHFQRSLQPCMAHVINFCPVVYEEQ